MNFFILAALSIFAVVTPPRQAQGPVQTAHRRSPYVGAIALDAATGNVLLEDNSTQECYPASCTKLMTLHLALKAIKEGSLKLDDRLYASRVAILEKPSILGLKEGESISVKSALGAIMVKSANDVAVMLAERIGGTKEKFVAMMNEEALALGMKHTKYVTPNGYPPGNTKRGFDVSTAADLAILGRTIVLEQPEALEYTSIITLNVPEVKARDGRLLDMQNHNNFLWKKQWRMKEVDGLKTGYHDAGGSSIVLTGTRNGKRAIVVVTGSSTAVERDKAAGRMLQDALGALVW